MAGGFNEPRRAGRGLRGAGQETVWPSKRSRHTRSGERGVSSGLAAVANSLFAAKTVGNQQSIVVHWKVAHEWSEPAASADSYACFLLPVLLGRSSPLAQLRYSWRLHAVRPDGAIQRHTAPGGGSLAGAAP